MARQELVTFTCVGCPGRATCVSTTDGRVSQAFCDRCAPQGGPFARLPRVGRGMLDACIAVSAGNGPTKHAVSVQIGPHQSNAYGWAIVQRAIKAGLIQDIGTERRSQLMLTELGWQLTADYR